MTNNPELYQLHALICKTFSDAKRLLIINELRHGEKSVKELAQALGLSHSNISQHLALMRERGILESRRQGATIYYSVASPKILEAFDLLREVLAEVLQRRQQLAQGLNAVAAGSEGG